MRVQKYRYNLTLDSMKTEKLVIFDCPDYSPYSNIDRRCSYNSFKDKPRNRECPMWGSGIVCYRLKRKYQYVTH